MFAAPLSPIMLLVSRCERVFMQILFPNIGITRKALPFRTQNLCITYSSIHQARAIFSFLFVCSEWSDWAKVADFFPDGAHIFWTNIIMFAGQYYKILTAPTDRPTFRQQIELFQARHGRNKRNEIEQTKAYLRERFDRALEQPSVAQPAVEGDPARQTLSNVEVVCPGVVRLPCCVCCCCCRWTERSPPTGANEGNEICGEIERYMLGILFALFYLYSNFINLFCKLRVCEREWGRSGIVIPECGLLLAEEKKI